MRVRLGNRRGQTMVEYIIIVVLIAITLIILFSRLSKATGTKIAGATSALDNNIGTAAAGDVNNIDENRIRNLNSNGTFQ